MKEKRTTRLYEGLSNKEKAALTLHYMTERNGVEIDRIRSAVPWKEYSCIDAEYTDWRDTLVHISLCWGLMYWEALYVQVVALFRLSRLDLGATDAKALKAFGEAEDRAQQSLARILALEVALADVCNECGLAPDEVMKLANVRANDWPHCEPDAEYREQVKQELLECLPDAEASRRLDA